ncbi:hypothetical protein [Novosphingobium beihaiensis]|uniref:Uncharacterized protein n=1 Tax=Novosphingobium beihaiensis TaxID=2930389 RepID=A0ABT0BW51_9SPHN|nr:hypothetical protein [Novosphingobium beihaiensis]MCJ2189283.1 hypothetical protein [Novosphingobium beihaiensis]
MIRIFGRKKDERSVKSESDQPLGKPPKEGILLEAARFTTFVSSIKDLPELLVTNITNPIRCSSKNNLWDGVSFLFQSREGVIGKIYFFPNFVSAWPDGEPSPRPQIPTDYITEMFPEYEEALKHLLITIPRPFDGPAHIAN